MRLVRNTTTDGMCKFSLIEHEKQDHVEHGLPRTENEFFVIKLKDEHARRALLAYADSVAESSPEGYADEYVVDLQDLADRAGERSPWCKAPD